MTIHTIGPRWHVGKQGDHLLAVFREVTPAKAPARVDWALYDCEVRGSSPNLETAARDALAAWQRETGRVAA